MDKITAVNVPNEVLASLQKRDFKASTFMSVQTFMRPGGPNSEYPQDTVVLLGMDDLNGDALVPELMRKHGVAGPIIGVVSKQKIPSADREEVEVSFLKAGGDCLLWAPISGRLLEESIRAVVRGFERTERSPKLDDRGTTGPLKFGHGRYEINIVRHQLRVDGRVVRVTATEFSLLVHMGKQPGIYFSRSELMESADMGPDVFDRNVDNHIRRLRDRIRKVVNGAEREIVTYYKVGYKVNP